MDGDPPMDQLFDWGFQVVGFMGGLADQLDALAQDRAKACRRFARGLEVALQGVFDSDGKLVLREGEG